MTLTDRCLRWLRSIAVITGVPVYDSVQSRQFQVFTEHRDAARAGRIDKKPMTPAEGPVIYALLGDTSRGYC
ncbi:hypothetical protein DPMN_039951 [Dreissena polymorpha]|uniref:Uncharacterized protein n=1 Tax=Dreissena polymorpha TaxID=45954 RepID=A0A9D4HUI8_DREPO|nr:hypothetical protein DPMN_039951 [Dreissena polymorpha]